MSTSESERGSHLLFLSVVVFRILLKPVGTLLWIGRLSNFWKITKICIVIS
jgi:hypothetical protein